MARKHHAPYYANFRERAVKVVLDGFTSPLPPHLARVVDLVAARCVHPPDVCEEGFVPHGLEPVAIGFRRDAFGQPLVVIVVDPRVSQSDLCERSRIRHSSDHEKCRGSRLRSGPS